MVGGKGKLDFAGVVTQVETARFSGHAGDLIITGYSPTILLDSGPHCKSWEKKAIKNIATDCLSHFPQNLLKNVMHVRTTTKNKKQQNVLTAIGYVL